MKNSAQMIIAMCAAMTPGCFPKLNRYAGNVKSDEDSAISINAAIDKRNKRNLKRKQLTSTIGDKE